MSKYPRWLNALAWCTLALPPVGLVTILFGETESGLAVMLVGFLLLSVFGELASRLKHRQEGNNGSR